MSRLMELQKQKHLRLNLEIHLWKKGKNLDLNGGIDAKIGVTNNMTMDLTINPDFGQVEADPSEVNLSAYETFFRRKDPFSLREII